MEQIDLPGMEDLILGVHVVHPKGCAAKHNGGELGVVELAMGRKWGRCEVANSVAVNADKLATGQP